MERINKIISWYQAKIGTYDKQLWEMSAEQKVIKSLHSIPRKTTTLKSGLIDVDLVRGSTFSKAKPSHGWSTVARIALFRVTFFPLYYKWWIQQTSKKFFFLMLVLYFCQIIASVLYLSNWGSYLLDQVPLSEMVSPVILMAVLGIIHGQMVSTHHSSNKGPSFVNKKKKKSKMKRSQSSNHSSKRTSANEDPLKENTSQSHVKTKITCFKDDASSSDSSVCNTDMRTGVYSTDKQNSKSLLNSVASSAVPVEASNECEDQCPELVLPVNNQPDTSTIAAVIQPSTEIKTPSLSNEIDLDSTTVDREAHKSMVTDISKPPISSSDDTGTDTFEVVSSEPIVYKPLNDDDTVQANTYEDPSLLNQPIKETVGELLLTSDLDDCEGTIVESDSVCHEEPEDVDVNASSYIPSVKSQEEGNLNLLGIKQRCRIGNQNHHIRHHSTSDVDNLNETNSTSAPLISGGVPDPVITINVMTTKNSSNQPSTSRVDLNRPATYVPSCNQEQGSGNLDLIGIKHRQQVGTYLRRRKRSPTKLTYTGTTECPMPVQPFVLANNELQLSPGASSCESGAESTLPHTPTTQKCNFSELESEDRMRSSEMASSDTSSFSSEGESNTEQLSGVEDPFNSTHHSHHVGLIPSASDSVSCVIWERGDAKKVDLSVIDIGWHIIDKVEKIPQLSDYVIIGVLFTLLVFLLPLCFKVYHARDTLDMTTPTGIRDGAETVFGNNWSMLLVGGNVLLQRLVLSLVFFFLLSVAERTFKQRLLYAKNFCYLTSSRKARKYDLPHFRLNKVRNIKTWLSLRSYLKKKGPQRSVNTVVSAAFLLAITLASLVCIQLLKDSEHFLQYFYNWELLLWCLCLGTYLLRFMTLGTKINKKYRNLSVLITEQINLYLHMEQKPHKKEELMLANSVLKLAEDLLKEVDQNFKLWESLTNPYLSAVTRVFLLSSFSAIVSEFAGFRLRLHGLYKWTS